MSNTYAIDPETGLPIVVCLDELFREFRDDISTSGQHTYENALDYANSDFDKAAAGSYSSPDSTFSQFTNAELTEMIQNWSFGFDGGILSSKQQEMIQELRQHITYLRLQEKEDRKMKIAMAIGIAAIIITIILWIISLIH